MSATIETSDEEIFRRSLVCARESQEKEKLQQVVLLQ
jgi:hypothetical protein